MKEDWKGLATGLEEETEAGPFSGVIRVSRRDQVLFESAHGWAIRSESIPNRTDTRFQIASGCKVFTSVAIAQQVEQGRLDLETPLRDCVDVSFPHHAPGITIRHLLSHTSGITSYFEEDQVPDYELLWQERPMYRFRSPRDYLPLFRDRPMKFAPGERFEYNDGGFVLLGLVLECVTGREFSALIREGIFEPAGMTDSGYFSTDRLPERTAFAYIQDPDGSWRTNFFAVPIVGGPDGGAYTTAADLSRFWEALIGGTLLGPERTRDFLVPAVETSMKAPHGGYGCGVWIDVQGDSVRKTFVEGFDPGVAMRSAYYPGEDVVLSVLGNAGEAVWPLYRRIEAILDL